VTYRNRKEERVYLADLVGPDRAPYEAELLKEAGARSLSRDSGARWFGHIFDPVIAAWVAAQKRAGEDPYA
jgi:hypothetical protein